MSPCCAARVWGVDPWRCPTGSNRAEGLQPDISCGRDPTPNRQRQRRRRPLATSKNSPPAYHSGAPKRPARSPSTPPFLPETDKVSPRGEAPIADAISASNGADSKFTECELIGSWRTIAIGDGSYLAREEFHPIQPIQILPLLASADSSVQAALLHLLRTRAALPSGPTG